MARCNFSISFSGTPTELAENVRTKVETQGGTFTEDASGGIFKVPLLGSNINGSYTIDGQQMNIIIDHKPIFVGCGQIENYLYSNWL